MRRRRCLMALGLPGLVGLLGLLVGCGPTPPPLQPRTVRVTVTDERGPVEGATVLLDASDPTGTHIALTDSSGVATLPLVPPLWTATQATVTKAGCLPLSDGRIVLPRGSDAALPFHLTCLATLPRPPTRAEALNVHLSFQGLTVHCDEWGDFPYFEGALPWLSPSCREQVYQAKHASTAWPGGDTHALVFLPSGAPLYDEPGQFYTRDKFGPLDLTNGNMLVAPSWVALVREVVAHGFTALVFLGGDDGEFGYPIAVRQLPLVTAALAAADVDLNQYSVIVPGFDGVFYGWTPEHIKAFGRQFRALLPNGYLGIEHSTGHIPTGEGDSDWTGDGGMRTYDLLLSEFDDGRFDDSVWQIAARLLGPAYVRPSDQPADDDVGAPFYLKQPTARGPIVDCAFEFWTYGWVRDAPLAAVESARGYFKRLGYTCGG